MNHPGKRNGNEWWKFLIGLGNGKKNRVAREWDKWVRMW